MTSRTGFTNTMAPKAVQLLLNTSTGAPADGVSSNTCSVLLLTSTGQAWPQKAVVVTATGNAQMSWDHLPQTLAVVTNASGEVNFTLTDQTAESVVVTATLVGDASVTYSASSTFVAAAGNSTEQPDLQPDNRANILIMTVNSGAGADGKQTNSGMIRLVDNLGIPLAGRTLCLSCSGNALIQSTQTSPQIIAVMTDADGTALINITDTVVESVLVDAVLVDDGTVTDGSNVEFTQPDTTTVISDMTVSPASIPADGQTQAIFTVTVKNGITPAAGQTVHWSIISGEGILTPLTSTTNSAGLATTQLISDTQGMVTVRAACNGAYKEADVIVEQALEVYLVTGAPSLGSINPDESYHPTNKIWLKGMPGKKYKITLSGSAIFHKSGIDNVNVTLAEEWTLLDEITDQITETCQVVILDENQTAVYSGTMDFVSFGGFTNYLRVKANSGAPAGVSTNMSSGPGRNRIYFDSNEITPTSVTATIIAGSATFSTGGQTQSKSLNARPYDAFFDIQSEIAGQVEVTLKTSSGQSIKVFSTFK